MTSWWKRTGGAAVASILLGGVSPAGPGTLAQTSHSVLLVVLDDIGVDRLGVYGEAGACSGDGSACTMDTDCPAGQSCFADVPSTPTIDQLAQDGVLFRNAWAAPTCSPTRATFLTGRHGFRTGVFRPGNELAAGELTLAEILGDPVLGSGCAQAAIGKWHLGGGSTGPNDQGFEFFAGGLGGGVGNYFDWNRTVNGTTDDCFPGSTACPVDAWAPTVNVNDALDWLDDQTGPWFLYLSFNAPHSPFHVPPHDLVSTGTLARLPQAGGQPAPAGTSCSGGQRAVCYLAMVEAVDTELGRFLQSLTEPATVMLLGDNGTPRAPTLPPFDPARAKGSPYEGGVNVPLIIRHASGLSAGQESTALVHSTDLFATVLELTGSQAPPDRAIDGISLVPLLVDPDGRVRDRLYTDANTSRALRDERFKMIRHSDFDELYDLEGAPPSVSGDPFELVDLLVGTCSITGGQACHVDADCPGSETCLVGPLSDEQASAAAELALFDDLTRASCDPLLCPAALTCASAAMLTASSAGGGTVNLAWAPVQGAALYDVLRGDVSALRAGGGDFATATEACLADNLGAFALSDAGIPPVGTASWYLVRAAGSPCNGTYGEGSGLTGLRNLRIGQSPSACPD